MAKADKPHRRTPTDDEPTRSFKRLQDHLARAESEESCALFHQMVATRWVPRRPDLVPWLEERIGSRATTLLVGHFARLPCHFCHGQLSVCAACNGDGVAGPGLACPVCAGLGAARCEACDGSGLVNYESVPVGLRHAVLRHRLADAAHHLRAARARPRLPSVDSLHDRAMVILGARAVLDSALRAARAGSPNALSAPDFVPRASYAHVKRLCATLAADSEAALRQALADLAAEYERLGARDRSGSETARHLGAHLLHVAGQTRFKSPLLIRKDLERIA